MRSAVTFQLNGVLQTVRGPDVWRMTADWLRRDRALTGTKIVCAEGDCGACTILRAQAKPNPQFQSLNACITPLFTLDGCVVLTVEALAEHGQLHPVQTAMRDQHGAQCGYCTPGFVMALAGALEEHPRLTARQAANELTGNLCRCTGYAHILEAATAVTLPNAGLLAKRFLTGKTLGRLRLQLREPLRVQADHAELLAPTTLSEAAQFLLDHPDARIVAAATDLGVVANRGKPLPNFCLTLQNIPQLSRISVQKQTVTLGARVTLTELRHAVRDLLPELAGMLDVFASPQIKNAATLVGNIANGSPIGDTLPFLLVSNARVQAVRMGEKGLQKRWILLTKLYLGYRQLALQPGELLAQVAFDLPQPGEVLKLYKVAQRKDLDISTVAAAILCRLDAQGQVLTAKLAYGGVAATPIRLPALEKWLLGKKLDAPTLKEAKLRLQSLLSPLSDLRGGALYRRQVAGNLLERYAHDLKAPPPKIQQPLQIQLEQSPDSPPHDAAQGHVTGLSQYVDDRPPEPGELHVGVVFSPHARARILAIDARQTLKIPGVVQVFTAKDLAHNLWGSIFIDQPILAHEDVHFVGEAVALVAAQTPEVLQIALKTVHVRYEILPAILTVDAALAAQSFFGAERFIVRGDAQKALAASPHTLHGTLKIAGQDHFYLENQGAIAYPRENGRLEVHSSTQHTTETQHLAAEACGVPFADVTCITQRLGGGFGGKESQAGPIAAWAALVAHKTGKPARLVLNKDDDMISTGKRNPYQIDWQVGFDNEGHILGLKADLWGNGGAFADLSTAILERAMLHVDNATFLPNVQIRGRVCRTHEQPHTAFRGFGGPKGVALIEHIQERIARVLGLDALDVRMRNVYAPGKDVTPYGQVVENNQLPAIYQTLEKTSAYRERRTEIRRWNQENHQTIRGLSLTAVKFGIAFTTRFLNQANALVILHRDASVQVSTGAVEMGQGVQTRVAQLVAEQFGLPLQRVRMMPTATDKNANTSPTAASSGTDLNGAAAMDACHRLKLRLATLLLRLQDVPPAQWGSKIAGLGTRPEIEVGQGDPGALTQVEFADGQVRVLATDFHLPLADLLREAWLQRISLTEYGFFRTPHLAFDKLAGQGRAFLYFTQGAAVSEVEIDRLTGETKVRRVDILLDAGRPVNAALDVGQIAGGFVQGMGWVTTEKLFYDAAGKLLSHAPSTYKIPNIQDMPRDFRVALWPNDDNVANLRGTKAVGEPPLLLGISVWTAILDALADVQGQVPNLGIPATAEAILGALTGN